MYQDFYQLNSDPFRLSPDHTFCFHYPSFAKSKAYMRYALQTGEGFVMITGRPGMGKTTLINDMLAEYNPSDFLIATLVNTQLEAGELLRMMAYDFGLNLPNLDKATVLYKLKQFFIHAHQTKRPPLLIVDEAQNLSLGALEELRLLTNLQIANRPLLQMFMVGQEGLRTRFQEPSLEQFRQRLMGACHLEPLTLVQTTAYVIHRLRVAGWKNNPKIRAEAFPIIHAVSDGIPRHINRFCSRLLLHAALEEKNDISVEETRLVVSELDDELLHSLPGDHLSVIQSIHPDQAWLSPGGRFDPQALLSEAEKLLQEEENNKPRQQAAAPGPESPPLSTAPTETAEQNKSVNAVPAQVRSTGSTGSARTTPSEEPGNMAAYNGGIGRAPPREPKPEFGSAPTLEPRQVSSPGVLPSGPGETDEISEQAEAETTKPDKNKTEQLLTPPSSWTRYVYAALLLLTVGVAYLLVPIEQITGLISQQPPEGLIEGKDPSQLTRGSSFGDDAEATQYPAPPIRVTKDISRTNSPSFKGPVEGIVERDSAFVDSAAGTHPEPQGPPSGQWRNSDAEGLRETLGVERLGSDTLGSGTPSSTPPETGTLGFGNPGPNAHRSDNLGPDTPGPNTLGSVTPGPDTLGSDTLGSDTPGSDTPGSDTPGSDTPGSDTPGSDTLGYDTPDSDIPRSDTISSNTHGSESLFSETIDTEVGTVPLVTARSSSRIIKQISFAFDSTEIRARDWRLLNEVVLTLKEYADWKAHIVGYTDSVGKKHYNERLSRLRAEAVANYLTERGISADRLRIEGKGSSAVVLPGDGSQTGTPPARLVQIILAPSPEQTRNHSAAPVYTRLYKAEVPVLSYRNSGQPS